MCGHITEAATRPFRVTTLTEAHKPDTPDLLERGFTATAVGAKPVGDITYIRTWQGWLYLAMVIDCYSKTVVGWSMTGHMKTSRITGALRMAAGKLSLIEACEFHSDRGNKYFLQHH